MNTDTPRTDAIPRNGAFNHYRVEDVLDLARTLERELAEVAAANLRWCAKSTAQAAQEQPFDGYAMYPTDINLLLERLWAEVPDEMSALDTVIMDQCKTIMRENKAHWERVGTHEAAK